MLKKIINFTIIYIEIERYISKYIQGCIKELKYVGDT